MFEDCKNTKAQGTVGLGEAIAWFSRNRYNVSLPISDTQRYDLIVEKNSILERVEVKTSCYKAPSGNYEVVLKTCGGNRSAKDRITYFSANDSDILFILVGDGTKYLIPSKNANKSNITLGEKYIKYKIE